MTTIKTDKTKLTAKQRELHLQAISNLLTKYCTLDRWNTYRIGDYRFDNRKINLKISKSGDKIFSEPLVKVSIEKLEQKLINIKKSLK